MKKLRICIALALLAAPVYAGTESGLYANMGTCYDGSPREYFIVDATSATSCAGGGSTFEAHCCCKDGSWATCSTAGGTSNSFETVNAPSGTDPVAGSATDTLNLTAAGGITITGNSGTDTLAFDFASTSLLPAVSAPAVDAANAVWGVSTGLVFEGSTANTSETTLSATDPTADNAITLPNAPGQVVLSSCATCSVDAANGLSANSNGWVFEGATADGFETLLYPTDPTADRFQQMYDATGYVMLSDCATCTTNVANGVMGTTNGFLFEGTTANGFETTLLAGDPTADRTLTLPDNTGTLLSTGGGAALVLDSDATATTIVSSAAETTIYSYAIPAGTVDANGVLRLTMLNEWFNNSGASRSLDLRVKLGGTTVIAWNTGNYVVSATRRLTRLEIHLAAQNATNSQRVWLFGVIPTITATGTVSTGMGVATTATTSLHISSGDLTKDMTASQTLEVTIQHSASHASLEWKAYSATLELLNP